MIKILCDGFILTMDYDHECEIDREILAEAYMLIVRRSKRTTTTEGNV